MGVCPYKIRIKGLQAHVDVLQEEKESENEEEGEQSSDTSTTTKAGLKLSSNKAAPASNKASITSRLE